MKFSDIEMVKYLSKLQKQNIEVYLINDTLHILDGDNLITDEILSNLKGNRAQIIGILQQHLISDKVNDFVERNDDIPLSFAQERLWFMDQYDHNASYDIPMAIRLFGRLSTDVLEKTLMSIISRHEVLRTNFVTINNGPKQVIHENPTSRLEVVNLSHLSKEAADSQILGSIHKESQKPFDLANDSLIRFILYTISEEESVLFMNQHHIISDGWSFSILINEITQIYEAYSNGKPSPLTDLPIQYADYAIWQRSYLEGERLQRQAAYWKDKLEGVAILELPTDKPRPKEQTFNGNRLPLHLSKALTDKLKQLSKEHDVTLFMTLLSVFKILLQRYTGQSDICVGSPIANRTREEVEGLIGFFVNTLALRSNVATDLPFNKFLKNVRATTMEAYESQDIPFEKVVDIVEPERNLSYSPLFQVMMVLQNNPGGELKFSGLNIEPVVIESVVSKFDITLDFIETGAGLYGNIEYNTDLFDRATIERLGKHFIVLVEQVTENPGTQIKDLEILTPEEKHQLLVEWNATEVDYPRGKCIHHLFEDQVAKTPDNVAIVFETSQLTYSELNEKSNQLAHYLQERGVKPETLVGICVDRSLEMIIGLLGILKAGGAYVPIDPAYPEDRISYMLDDAGCGIVLTQEHIGLVQAGTEVIYLDSDWDNIGNSPTSNVISGVKSDNLAYVIYTSGSTGKPKGSLIEHGNVISLFCDKGFQFDFSEKDVWSLFHSYCFDFSVWEMYGALLFGGKLVIIPKEITKDPERFCDLIEKHKITVLNQTPSAFYNLSDYVHRRVVNLSLRYVVFGGEELAPSKLKFWYDNYPACRLINMYGITETTVHVTYKEISEFEISNNISNIGKPISTLSTYVLDKNKKLLPIGLPGELCVSGAGVCRGYLKNDRLTKEKFQDNPFVQGEKIYLSGDSAYLNEFGELIYCGRIDDQVKIRGFRIELGEIESVLNTQEGVNTSVVLAKEDKGGNKRLVAYFVSDAELNIQELRDELSRTLPAYMVPSLFVRLDAMPLTSNGKVDKKALPDPEGNLETTNDYVAPVTEIEKKLAGIWQELLGVERVGIYDNFFELGGHSLLATQVISKIRTEFNNELPLKVLFESSTIQALSKQIDAGKLDEVQLGMIPAVSREDDIPLSFAQERLWFIDQYDHNASYNMPGAIRLFGALNIEVLEKTLLAIVSRHEVLRTNFVTINNGAKQVIHESATSRLEIVNLSHLSKEAADSQILGSIHKESQKPFDLANDSLIRFILYTISEEESVLFMNQHHIVSDGWSFSILINEITQIYEAYSNGKPSPLTDLPIQYADYAIWQRAYLEGERLQKQADYWKDKLEGVAILELPTDKPRPKEQTFNGNRLPIHLNKALTEKLQQLSRENDATLFMTLLSVFKILLQRYTGQSDICVGSPIANRTRAEIEPLIGFFVNTLALRSDVATDLPFNKFLKNVRSTTLEAYESQDIPFEKVVDIVEPERNLSYSPLFQAMMVLQNNPEGELKFSGLNIEPVVIESVVSKFDITLDFIETGAGLYGNIEYNTDLFDRATIERMANHFIVLVEQVTENPGRQIKDLEVLTPEEKHQLLVEWNDTGVDYPRGKCIHQLFEDQVAKTPANIAVVFEEEELTYGQLNEKANQLGHYLQERGVKPETLVGICVDRSLEMIIGLLGILKAGGAYVPIDPAYPEDRISYMLEDAGCGIVLTQEHIGLVQAGTEVIYLDSDWDNIGKRPTENVRSGVKSDNLAYVIYTSGSTGKPKGTIINHSSVQNLIQWHNREFRVSEKSKSTQLANIAFDASVWEIWPYLTCGSSLYLVKKEYLTDTKRIIEYLNVNSISHSFIPTAIAESILSQNWVKNTSLNYVLIGGDRFKGNNLNIDNCKFKLINNYGPTENTVVSTSCEINDSKLFSSIGKPIDNTKVYILDNNLNLTPIGIAGELCISGDGLARGYLNQPELTAEQFIKNPFSEDRTSRLYKTGDLARYLPDGNIEFLGRIDDQVKIRGFRIELGEIESVLNTQEGVNTSVVLAKEVSDGNKQLVAYIVPSRDTENDASLNIKELREELSKTLPDYMVPSLFVRLDAMPLTSNGKVDKKALPEPEGNLETTNDYVAPVKENEKKLAGIWQELLGVERVGIYDNFFELGGDSIISIQVVSRANQQGLIISPKDVFKYQTVSTLAKVCGAKKTEIKAEQSFVKGEVGLTPIQSWYFGNNLANKDHFNQAVILQVEESLEVQMLENALNAIFRQHDVLRLFYKYENNRWLQEHKEFSILKLDVIDLTGKSGTELSKEIDKEATKIQAGLSIGRGEIFKPLLFKTAPGQANHLLLVIHHLAVDGVSWRILIEDIRKSCEQQIEGRSINLGSKTSSFKQWFERLNDYAHSDELSKELPFWKSIAEEPVMRLPIDKNEGENTVGSAANVSINLSKELTRSLLQDAGKAYNTRINDLLLSALGITISKWIRENDIIINLEGHGREELFADMDISRTVGWFTSLFPVCISLNGTTDIGDIIKSVKEQLRALPNKGIGYGILRYLKEDDAIRNSVKLKSEPEISFNYLGQFNELEKSDEQTIISISGESSGQSVCPTNQRSNIIDINSIVSNGELVLTWSYSENLHSRKTIEALASNYVSELTTIIEHCLLPASGAFTPSDFPLCRLSQEELDKYVIADTSIDAIENIYPLSPMQEGMLFHSLYSPTSEVYVTQLSVDLVGELDPVIFQKAWQHIIATHSILRTSFVIGGVSTPLQRVHKAVNCDIIPLDYSDLGKGDWDRNIEALMESDRKKGFDFTKAPLSRFRLIKLTDSRHTFAWTHHHMLMDGWSVPIIFKELFQNYQAFSNDKSLPIKLDKYEDLIAHLAAKDKTKSEQFWKTYLKGFMTPTEISVADNLHKADETDSYNRRGIQLSKQETKSLQEFAKKHRLTVNTLVQGAWAKILQVYSGEENVVFGMTVSGRPVELEGAEEKVGLFINTLPLRINAGNNITVLKWLETIQEQQLLVREHEYMPLVEIQSLSSVSNNGQLFSSILVFENYPIGNTSEGAGVPIRIDRVRSFEKTNYPLTISASLIDQLTIEFSYNQSVYKLGTIERVLGQLKEVLKNIVKNSNELISNIEVLTPEEKHQLLVEWNDTDVDYPREKCIHHLFEDQVGKTPANIAVVFEDNQLTYNELNEKSNQLAHYLQERGVKPETLVGICVDRSLEMIIGLLAILKAGGAYVPIDPAYPEDRISYMLDDAGCGIVLTQEHIGLVQAGTEVIYLDSDWDNIGNSPTSNVISGVKSDNLAYVIYTSGSTGKPKGIAVMHLNYINYILWAKEYYFDNSEIGNFSLFTSISFDLTTTCIFLSLIKGKTLEVFDPKAEFSDILTQYFQNEGIDSIKLTPSHISLLAGLGLENTKIRLAIIGGEELRNEQVEILKRLNKDIRVFNEYGPTEATVGCIVKEIDSSKEQITIGKPINNTKVYVLDKAQRLVPIGAKGELYISGDGLARGYLNQPELTAEKFIKNPFSDDPQSRLYKTGDLARYLPDGNIEFLGRLDDQVKIRGFRIELGEIESVLNTQEGVNTSVVLAKEDKGGNKRLVAYFVSDAELNIQELRDELSRTLPAYMVPSLFVRLDAMPLTSNGKVDKKALPDPEGNLETTNDYVAPVKEIEKKLAGIWQELLGVERVGIYDNFFELGGHSLLATQVISKIRTEFNNELPLKVLFESSTIQALSKQIDAGKLDEVQLGMIPAVSREDDIPLSFAQERLWFIDQYDHNASYNMPGAIRLFGALNIEVLEKTLLAIVSRHEVLRTNFVTINNGAKQVIHESATSRLEIVNLSHLSKEAADSQILGSIHKESQKPFDLANDSLIRFILYTISEEESVLFMNQHHIVSDGWSFSILINEITQIYEAYSNGKPSPLTDLPIQYADYAIWQRAYLEGERLQKQADYWKDKLEGVAILELPTDKPRPKEQTFNGNRLPIHLNKALTEKLQQLSRENDATLFMTLLSVFKILLQRYTGQSDICVGSPIANRTRAEIEPLIGFFVNTLALRSDVATDLPFNKFLKNVRSTTLEAYESQDIPFEKVVDIVEPERNLSYSPLFQAMMVLQNNPEGELKFSGLNIEPVVIESVVSKFDITLDFIETGAGLYGNIEYNTDLFDRATIERMANHFIVLVEQVTENPGRQIKDLEVLTPEEKHQLLVEWNDTDVDYPRGKCIHQLFEDQVAKTPANIAVVFEEEELTYGQLNEKANQLGHYLQERGVKPETLVGICVDRSLEMIIGLLGILKAGGAYVPIDPAYPEDRISYMLEDAGCGIVLTQEHIGLVQAGTEVIYLDSDWDNIGKRPTENVRSGVKSDNLAYVIYTSGSTGKPKGVMLEHKNTNSLLEWARKIYSIQELAGTFASTSITFDLSVFELYLPLSIGGSIILGQNILSFNESINKQKITLINTIPSAIRQLLDQKAISTTVKTINLAGEYLRRELVDELYGELQNVKVYDLYGPSEDTTYTTFSLRTIGGRATIGKPIDNTKVYILDNNLNLTPIGIAGELCISGDGLARGYLNQPELTAEQFIKNPFSEDRTSRLYKTGDLARYLPDGNIEFLGRIDDQVKIRGFRIELGEIESVLNTQEGVNTSVVLAKEVSDGNKQLVAYIVPSRDTENDASLNIKELREELSKTLPDYMVPSLFVRLDAMPLTSNGKVDKKALPEPEGNLETTNDYVAPVKENEKKLAGIWQELLGVERVGIYDNFFELGGDSIISIQVVSRANQQGLIISPKDVFKYQTVSTLAKVCGAKKTEIKAEQSFVKGEVGLTPIQSWYFGNNLANKDHFNQAVILQVEESLEVQMLENALNAIFRQHDVLRLFYKYENNRWLQEHKEFSILKLDVIDLTGKSGTELSKEIDKEATKIQAGLSIGRGEIFKPLLFKTAPGQANHLLLVIHHLAVDGVSWRILIEDIRKSCEQQIEGRSINLGSKTSSFKQWFERLNDYAHSDELSKELPFWKSIAEEPVMRLPIDKNEGENTVGSAANVSINLSKELTRSLLQDAGKAYNTRINDLLLSALGITISKWIRENDIIINLEGHGREELFADMDISRTVGWFTSLFPVCISLNGTTDIGDIIKSVKEQLRALPNKGIGYGILRYLKEDDAIRNSVKLKSEPEISFNYLGQFNELEKSDEQTIISISGESSGQSVCPTNQRSNIIDINSIVSNGELVLTWSYSENLHSRKTIEALASNYVSELTTIIEHCLLPASGAFTPSDFPLCRLSQEELDKYVIADTSIDAIENIYPLSPMQEGMLFHSLYSPTSEVYVTQLSVDLVGELDPVIFQKAWQHIIATHSILRTSFVIGGVSTPLQRVHKAVNCDIIPLDYSDLGKGDWDRNIEALMESDRKKGFDFTKAPLSRFRLIKLTDSRHTFAWTHHHMLMDGWSVPIIFKELFQNYQAFSNDKSLPIKLDKYEDLIAHLAAKDKTKSEQFWKTYLKGFMTPTEISVADNLHKADETDSYNRRGIQLSKQETKSLQEFAKKHRLTVNTLVQGAWAKILQVYSGEENVVFGMTVSGRPVELEGAEEKVGLFINTLPLRINAGNNITVLKWLETIQEQQLLVREHEYMPLVEIQSLSSVSNNGQLFSSILVFENYPIGNTSEGAGVPIRIDRVRSFEKTNYPLTISASLIDQLTIEFSYNQSVYKLGTIERVLGQLKEVLKNIVKNSNELISNIEVLTPEEKHQLLVEWNDTDVDYPREKCIHHLFEDQVGKTPANIAVVFEDNQLTYNELNEKSNQLAHYLQERGVKPETLVGICVDRSLEMIIGLLAILKAGGAYVPIDPAYPEDRISYMLDDAGCGIVLTQEHIGLVQAGTEVIYLDSDWDNIGNSPTSNVISGVKSDNLAYVIYTSGSTGKPKGIAVMHLNYINYILWAKEYYFDNSEIGNFSLFTSISFDLTTTCIFLSLIKGKTLEVFDPKAEFSDILTQYFQNEGIDSIKLTPSHISLLAGLGLENTKIRLAIIGGEELRNEQVEILKRLNKDIRVFNEYGPTEATVGCIVKEIDSSKEQITIGKPINNTKVYVLDKAQRLVPIGAKGELYISGDGLARGYLNQPELTAEKFIKNPFSDDPQSRLYKTGDLARYLPDGNIEFLGRLDDQVKIRGFRIELGEIESVLNTQEGVNTSVVLAKEDKGGNKRLVAYFVSDAELNIQELRDELSRTLPAYMVPSLFVRLDAMPLTSNGKVDKKALPDPEGNLETTNDYVAPVKEIEKKLAGIWQELLGVERVGIYDNFFELGGHSLLATQVISKIRTEFNNELPLKVLFESSTIQALSKQIDAGKLDEVQLDIVQKFNCSSKESEVGFDEIEF